MPDEVSRLKTHPISVAMTRGPDKALAGITGGPLFLREVFFTRGFFPTFGLGGGGGPGSAATGAWTPT